MMMLIGILMGFQRPSNRVGRLPTPIPTILPAPIPTTANALPTAFLPTPHTPRRLEGRLRALEGPCRLPPESKQASTGNFVLNGPTP